MNTKQKRPKKIRNLQHSRKIILDAAFLEIYKNGFQGVSIDEIIAKTNLTKGAFYHQFPTKLDLGYALVDEVIKPMIIERWIKPLDSFENPLEGILLQIKKLIGKSEPFHLKLGCPLNNLVQEMSPLDSEFHIRLQDALNLWIREINKQLIRAKKLGYLKQQVNTLHTAHFIIMSHEGFYGMLKGIDDPKIFKALYHSLKIYFKALSS